MPARRLWNLLCGAAVLLVAGFALASCGGDDDAGTTETTTRTQPTIPATTDISTATTTAEVGRPTIVRVRVVGGAPEGGIVRKTVQKGDSVVLVVTSDVAEEVHLHGYDLVRNIAAGGTVRIPFKATVPGRFELELEDRGVQIADLTVRP